MTTASELQTDITRLSKRRADLRDDLEKARAALEAARGALVDGDGTAAQVTAAQADYTALQEALDDLDGRIEAQRQAQEAATAREHRGEALRELKFIAGEATKQRAEYDAAMSEAVELLGPIAERLDAALNGLVAERTRFLRLATPLEPGLAKSYRFEHDARPPEARESARGLLDALRKGGANLSSVLTPWAGSYLESDFDRTVALSCPEPYGPAVVEALAALRRVKQFGR